MTQLILAILSFLGFIIGAFVNLRMMFVWIKKIKLKRQI